MPNPDSGNLPTDLANKGPAFKRKASAPAAPVNMKTANWDKIPGKAGPDRSAGVKKAKTYASSKGI